MMRGSAGFTFLIVRANSALRSTGIELQRTATSKSFLASRSISTELSLQLPTAHPACSSTELRTRNRALLYPLEMIILGIWCGLPLARSLFHRTRITRKGADQSNQLFWVMA